jgi:hypothetical protein
LFLLALGNLEQYFPHEEIDKLSLLLRFAAYYFS